ncbi:AAA family ATPase [Bosea sp. WAO]|uniref:AAA family ATPase n=1 Tax=Bosea sp. WAO TaxID=406341 RepID=UPI000833885D|nr:AAA family ATPase [Bosea sp. WAO]
MNRDVKAIRDRDRIIRNVGRFLACIAIIRGCRRLPQVRSGGPLALVLLLPEGADVDDYRQAAKFVASRSDQRRFAWEDAATRIECARELWSKDRKASGRDGILKEDRFIVLAEAASGVPDLVLAAADEVVALEKPEPRHLVAVGKVCLKQRVTAQQAEELASMPLGLLGSMLRPSRSVARSLESMRKALANQAAPVATREMRIDDLHGLGEAGDWARDLAIDLRDWRQGSIGWADVDRGILVSGPTGTGKTTFVKALARTCEVHLVLGSLARWQARGHLGDLLKAMRSAFDEAQRNAPSIIFIDEIDAVGDRERFGGPNAQYQTEVVAGLLECIDGAERREGVIVVGACNFPQRLDAALVRPGRLDRHIRIPLPDGAARDGILRWHLAGGIQGGDLSAVINRTEGWSGAALEQLVRDARRSARRARRTISAADLEAHLPPTIAFPDQMLRRAAVHEAGHAIAAVALGKPLEFAEIRETAELDIEYHALGGVRIGRAPVSEVTAQALQDEICLLLAGTAAEEILLGSRSAGGGGSRGSDLHLATLVALRIEASYGLGEGLAFLAAEGETELLRLLHASQAVRERVEEILAEQMVRARLLIQHHRIGADRVAKELLERKRVGSARIAALLSSSETVEPAADGASACGEMVQATSGHQA